MPRCDGSEAARGSAADILSDSIWALGFLHPDGRPVTLADCEYWTARFTAENTVRAQALVAIEQQGREADRFEHAELVRASRWGMLRLRAWSALEVLAREGVACHADD